MGKTKYFISYTTRTEANIQWAKWTEWFFRVVRGGDTTMQEYDFRVGDNFKEKMDEALKEADYVVCVLTREYLDSTNCREEWTNADHMMLIKFDDCEPKGLLKSRVYVDLYNLDRAAAREKLNEALNEKVRPMAEPYYPNCGEEPDYPTAAAYPKSNLPDRNQSFIGRSNELTKIDAALREHNSVLVTGQGGFGKTETAVEYAYRHAHEYECVWVFNAASESQLRSGYREFAVKFGLHEDMANDQKQVYDFVTERFKEIKCLFIYDSAEGCPNIWELLPHGPMGGHVLVNSRMNIRGRFGSRLPADIFSIDDAVAFIRSRVGDDVSDDDATKLSYSLGCLPLALEQAASYIKANGYTCAKYLGLLSRHGLRLLDTPAENTDYKKTVTTTWNITFEKLEENARSGGAARAALQLLYLCAYCAPDNIPLRMFIDARELLPPPLREALDPDDELSHNDVVGILEDYSVVSMRRDSDKLYLSMHSLVQGVLRRNLQKSKQLEWLSYCLDAALAVFDYTYDTKQSFDEFLSTLPHATAIADHVMSEFSEDDKKLKATSLYNKAGYGLLKTGDYAKAMEWYMKALAIREKALGNEHPDTAETYSNIAGVYANQGDYSKALEWYGKALAIKEKALGKEHPDTAETYNNIAVVYSRQGEYANALEWYGKALAIFEKALGKEHPDTATTYNNIAGVYDLQGEYAKALEWYGKALAIKEKALGKEHPSTATTYNNIAAVYDHQGEYAKALEWHWKALAIKEKTLGKEHPDTAATYNNIARVYHIQSEYTKALEWYWKALTIAEKALGKEHPDTATTYGNIAGVYDSQGEYAKALEWYLKSYRILVGKLGAAHPYTKTVLANMKSAYAAAGYTEGFDAWLQNDANAINISL